jgi:hypothetical protein
MLSVVYVKPKMEDGAKVPRAASVPRTGPEIAASLRSSQ